MVDVHVHRTDRHIRFPVVRALRPRAGRPRLSLIMRAGVRCFGSMRFGWGSVLAKLTCFACSLLCIERVASLIGTGSRKIWFGGHAASHASSLTMVFCNCFIRWVLILSRTSSRIDPKSDERADLVWTASETPNGGNSCRDGLVVVGASLPLAPIIHSAVS